MQIQKLQMRQNAMVQNPRLAGPVIHGAPSRINVGAPPPPPPYPGPPPPYPGSTTPQVPLSVPFSSEHAFYICGYGLAILFELIYY